MAVIESEQQLELAKQMSETFEKNQAFIANRFDNGLASSLENDLATSALASSQATKTMRERIRNAQVKELESFLGTYPKEDVDRNFLQLLCRNLPWPSYYYSGTGDGEPSGLAGGPFATGSERV